MTVEILLDEHVNRVFERVLEERGFSVEQAKDRFGERTTDQDLLRYCGDDGVAFITNNVKDFEPLHRRTAVSSSTTTNSSRTSIRRVSHEP